MEDVSGKTDDKFKDMTDKELIDAMGRYPSQSYDALTERYKPKIRGIMGKYFGPIKHTLRYDLNDLFPDIESEVWADLLKPRDVSNSLQFDNEDSIGGLVDVIARRRVISKFIRTQNHRSHLSTAERMELSQEDRAKSQSIGFIDFEDDEVPENRNTLESQQISLDLVQKIINGLTSEQSDILHLRSLGHTYDEVGEELGLNRDQVKYQLTKIRTMTSDL